MPEALIVLQSVVYGFGDPISKIAFEAVPVYAMMSIRYLIAFALTAFIFRKRILRTLREVPVRAWLLPGMCIGSSYVLSNIALSITEATSVAFLRSLSVVITPTIAFVVLGSRYRWQHMLIQAMVLPGTYLLCMQGGLSGFGLGEVLSILAALVTAAALVSSKHYLDRIDPMSLTSLMAGCSAVIALVGCLIFEGRMDLTGATPQVWSIILYLAVVCTFLGYLMQNLALMRISERSVSLIQSLCPVMTAIFSFFLLGEKLNITGIIGAGIIIACIASSSLIKQDSSIGE